MGRKSGISFGGGRGGYYTTIRGERHVLHRCEVDDRPTGPNYRAAQDAFDRIVADLNTPAAQDTTVSGCYAYWLAHMEVHSPLTVPIVRHLIDRFETRMRGRHVDIQFHSDALGWILGIKSWGPTTRGMAFRYLRQMTRHNYRFRRIPDDPLAAVKVPASFRSKVRGESYALPTALVNHLCENIQPRFRPVMTVLARTGARPGEIFNAEHFHYSKTDRTLVFKWNAERGYVHKTAKRKKNPTDRIIHLDDLADGIIRERASKRGFLFPTRDGTPIPDHGTGKAFRILRALPSTIELCEAHDRPVTCLIPYALRHTWITTALLNGVAIKLVADLAGTSVKVIEEHYSHAASNRPAMRLAFEQATRARVDPPQVP